MYQKLTNNTKKRKEKEKKQLILLLRKQKWVNPSDLCNLINRDRRTIKKYLDELCVKGIVKKTIFAPPEYKPFESYALKESTTKKDLSNS